MISSYHQMYILTQQTILGPPPQKTRGWPAKSRENEKKQKQAGAELCQAQVKMWLAQVGVVFHLSKKLRSSSISLKS